MEKHSPIECQIDEIRQKIERLEGLTQLLCDPNLGIPSCPDISESLAPKPDVVEDAVAEMLQPVHLQPLYLGMLQAVDYVLNMNKIPYWACGGTLIGALRHGGFIPHDDDIDIECYERDMPRIVAAFKTSGLPARFVFTGDWCGTKMGNVEFWGGGSELAIDVFLRDDALTPTQHFGSQSEVLPIVRCAFNGLQVCVPGGDPHATLARCYGGDWAHCVRVWTHENGDWDFDKQVRTAQRVPLAAYAAAVAALGYQPPTLYDDNVAEALSAIFNTGVVQLQLWEMLGWASPFPPPDGWCCEEDDD